MEQREADTNFSSRNLPMVLQSLPTVPLSRKLLIILAIIFICGSVAGGLFIGIVKTNTLPFSQSEEYEKTATAREDARKTNARNAFNSLSLIADSVIVIDHTTGSILYEKNAEKIRPIASVTKLQTALTSQKILSDSSTVVIKQDDLDQEGESGLRLGDTFDAHDLASYMLVTSSNDAAHALGRSIAERSSSGTYSSTANELGTSIGLTSSSFVNATGLDIDENAGKPSSLSTARDIGKLMAYILDSKWSLLEASAQPSYTLTSISGRTITGNNTNILVSDLPGLIMSKTGYTLLSGGNLAIAFDAGIGNPVIIVLLGSTKEGRFTDLQTLYKATLEYYRRYNDSVVPVPTL